ncbi:MAG: hypothetical protein ACQ9ET_01715 [Nitrosomonadaceae bacterium]
MPTVSLPILDKLSLNHELSASDSEGLTALIRQHINDRSMHIRYLGAWYHNYDYLNNWHLRLDGFPNAPILLQTVHKYRGGDFRAEWNPNNLGPEGNQYLWEALEELLSTEYEPFLNNALVTRTDTAVDITPLSPESIWVEVRGLQRGNTRTGQRGEVQSYELGSRRSDLYFCIYNRNPEDGHRISSDPYITRLEARTKPRCTLRELRSISNPFSRLNVVNAVDPDTLEQEHFRYIFFLDSVVRRGLQGALRRIPRYETRESYRQWICDRLCTDWFRPDLIWEDKQQMLDVLSLPPALTTRRRRRRRRHHETSA